VLRFDEGKRRMTLVDAKGQRSTFGTETAK
jgi:hypothetical protein